MPGEENWKGQGDKLDEMVGLPVRELAFAQDPKRQESDAYSILERNLILYCWVKLMFPHTGSHTTRPSRRDSH